MSTIPTVEAFTGCLLGGALGDALGYPIEFDTDPFAIHRRFGTAAPRALNFDGAETALISDDTQMTLFTSEGVIRGLQRSDRGICHLPTMVLHAYLRWFSTQGGVVEAFHRTGGLLEDERLHARRAPGNTCLSALEGLARNSTQQPSVSAPPNDSKGCGAVMRVAPIGLAARSRDAAWTLALETSVLTHGHPSGYLSAAYFASVIWDVSRGETLAGAMLGADALLARAQGSGEMTAILVRVRELARDGKVTPQIVEKLGGGWTGEEALAIALFCALTADRPRPRAVEDALWKSVVHAGDSDSTGSLTGNLLGAMWGRASLPDAWLGKLELRDVIERVATDLFDASVHGKAIDPVRYPLS